MENVLELNGLLMPSCFVSINDEEMEYVDGEWGFWEILAVITLGVAVLVLLHHIMIHYNWVCIV